MPADERYLCNRLVVYGGVHDFHLAVLAHPDAGPWTIYFPATDALPYRDALGTRIFISQKHHGSLLSDGVDPRILHYPRSAAELGVPAEEKMLSL